MATKMSYKDRITKAHIALMRNKDTVWMGGVCMVGAVHISPDCPTAGTDGRDVYYGEAFLDQCNEAQVRATVYHENWHKAALHLTIHQSLVSHYTTQFGEQQARQLINMAQDYVINRDVKRLAPFLETWEGIIDYCYDAKYDDDKVWDTRKIAEDLASQAKKGGKGGGGQGGGQGAGQPFKGGHDDHKWDDAKKISAEEQQATAKAVEQALRQGAVLSRKMKGDQPREVGELLTPAVDWRQALRDFVTERTKGNEYSTYAKPNRRYIGQNIYMPSQYSEAVEGILFACDTSGSIGADAIRDVLSEVQGCLEIVKPEVVDIMYWDTAVARHEHYAGVDAQNIMGSTKPAGGGGTAPSCVTQYCAVKNITPKIVVWLSDGCVGGDWAQGLPGHHFWVITHGGQAPSGIPHAVLPARG